MRRRARRMPELIPQAIDEIRTLCPDVLVVTGDLIDVPFYGMDDPTTTDQVCQDLTLLKRLIDPVGCPLWTLPRHRRHGMGGELDIPANQII